VSPKYNPKKRSFRSLIFITNSIKTSLKDSNSISVHYRKSHSFPPCSITLTFSQSLVGKFFLLFSLKGIKALEIAKHGNHPKIQAASPLELQIWAIESLNGSGTFAS
jgi:hypothetical protein